MSLDHKVLPANIKTKINALAEKIVRTQDCVVAYQSAAQIMDLVEEVW
jgi:hypothetical protein